MCSEGCVCTPLLFLAEDTAGGDDEARGRGTGATVGGQGGGH